MSEANHWVAIGFMTSEERDTFSAWFSDRPDFLPGPLDVVPEEEKMTKPRHPAGVSRVVAGE